jgi:kynurenine formamidase
MNGCGAGLGRGVAGLLGVWFVAGACCGGAGAVEVGRIVDLTHPFNSHTIYWPTEKGFQFQQGENGPTAKGYYYAANRFTTAEHGGTHLDAPRHFSANGPTAKGYYYAANRFTTAEHGGTHLDAPRHFSANGQTADQIPLDRLVGEAVVIDVVRQAAADATYLVTIDDLMAWEEAHGRQLRGVIVLLKTGWADRWEDRTAYLGTERIGPAAVAELRFPGLAPLAATWLAEERDIKAVGIDTASIDYGPSTHFETHVALCAANVPIFENVASLDELPAEGAWVTALPMKVEGGSGGPLRIIATLPTE